MRSHDLFRGPRIGLSLSVCVVVLVFTRAAQGQEEPVADLEKAVASLRNIQPDKLSKEEQQKKSKEMDEAWKVITLAGQKGIDRLKEEIAKIDREGVKDDFFKLDAAQLIWKLVGRRECDTIAAIWSSADLKEQYEGVFYTAVDAAKTQDRKVLPMLRALLRDNQGGVFVVQHSLTLKWPQTVEIVWGIYGPKGLPALLDILQTSKDPIEQQSAIILLGESYYMEALPMLRQFAKTGEGAPRCFAVEWVGDFGHPDDYEFLAAGLDSRDEALLAAHVRALTAYEDLRVVPALIKLLGTRNGEVQALVIDALQCLVTVDSVDALHRYSSETKNAAEAKECRKSVDNLLASLKMDWEAYAAKPSEEKAELLAASDRREARWRLRDKDRKLTHAEFVKAAKTWKKEHAITSDKYKWIENRHVIATATPQDIDLLLEVRAAVYCRVSDECFYEVDALNDLVRRLGRSRYREAAGVCSKVEPPRSPTSQGDDDGKSESAAPSQPSPQDD